MGSKVPVKFKMIVDCKLMIIVLFWINGLDVYIAFLK